MLQGDASREDKGNILRGCNVNRAGAEPLFMESLSCQGICQGPDLRSYLDKGAGGGEQSWRQSHRTPRAAARWGLIRRWPRGQSQNNSTRRRAGNRHRTPWFLLGLGCWGLQRPKITSPRLEALDPDSPLPIHEGRKSFTGKDLKENRCRETWFLLPCEP